MKETTPPKDPKKKLWIGYAVIIAILFACNLFLFPAMMQAKVKSVNYSTFLQMLESKELATVQIEDQQIYFVDKNENSFKTNAIAQDNNLVARLEDAGVEFGTVYQSPTIWDSLLNLIISFLPMILLFWFINRWASKKMEQMGGAGGNAVNHMWNLGIKDVGFMVCNTDAQALDNSPVEEKVQLGREGCLLYTSPSPRDTR